MKKGYIGTFLAIATFITATAAQAAVHRVFPGAPPNGDIQGAIDAASPGDTILVEPGVYYSDNPEFGLHITTDNLRLIGKVKKGRGEDGKVFILPSNDQITGVYAAPDGCGPDVGVGECPYQDLKGFYIRGFTVMDFPENGIQTRFVDGFKIIRNEVGDVDVNGIYPTISANGLVQNNVAYGTMDTAMWVAASENVRVIGNDLSGSPIGLEVNVSINVEIMHNDIYNNTVGVALFHPNSAGNDPRPDMGNWVVRQNNVYDNNLPNPAPDTSFQGQLPPGVGILLLGVYDNVVEKNTVEGNKLVGIGVLGWCSATQFVEGGFDCVSRPPIIDDVFYDPSVINNRVSQNKLRNNGSLDFDDPPPDLGDLAGLAADLTYFTLGSLALEGSSGGNCFEKNKPKNGLTAFSLPPFNGGAGSSDPSDLPTDGC